MPYRVARISPWIYTSGMGLVGERKALAAAVLAFYLVIYLLVALTVPPDQGLTQFFAAMAGLYGLSFFALVAGYFWARWFAIGLGIYGLLGGVLAVWQIGPIPEILFLGGTHGLLSLTLWGEKVAAHYDGRSEWRARFHLDDSGTQRLGKAVVRVGISLPILIGYGLMPRQSLGETILCLGVLGLVTVGAWGFLRLRTWGLVALAASAITVLVTLSAVGQVVPFGDGTSIDLTVNGATGGLILFLATVPFLGPVARYLRGS